MMSFQNNTPNVRSPKDEFLDEVFNHLMNIDAGQHSEVLIGVKNRLVEFHKINIDRIKEAIATNQKDLEFAEQVLKNIQGSV